MKSSRRSFLKAGLGGSSLVAMGASTVPGFLARSAMQAQETGDRGERVLVVVQLLGGNDGLNTVVPQKDPGYSKARKVLRLNPGQLVRMNDEIGLHPALTGMGKLLEENRLAILQGVGYPNPDRSHFRSMEIWETARVDNSADCLDSGWLGRAIDRPMGATTDLAIPALSFGGQGLPLALKSRLRPALAVQEIDQLRLKLANSEADRKAESAALASVAEGSVNSSPVLDFIRRSSLAAYESSHSLEQLLGKSEAVGSFPASGLGKRLASIAQIIKAGFPTPIFYTTLDGFDTHANQLGSHAALLAELGDALAAFDADLQAAGQANRVATVVFSEFGRRVTENASAGTDHGAAAPAFVVGPLARPGLLGDHPRLDDLDDGDLKHHTDFRRIYSSLLNDWLGLPAEPILGPGFEPLGLFS